MTWVLGYYYLFIILTVVLFNYFLTRSMMLYFYESIKWRCFIYLLFSTYYFSMATKFDQNVHLMSKTRWDIDFCYEFGRGRLTITANIGTRNYQISSFELKDDLKRKRNGSHRIHTVRIVQTVTGLLPKIPLMSSELISK